METKLFLLFRRFAVTVYQCNSPSFLVGLIYSSIVRWRFKKCGSRLRLSLSTVITGHRNIVIGNNLNTMGMLYLYAQDGGHLEIGDNCTVNTNVQLGATPGKIVIGNNVLIGPNVVIRAANHGIRKDQPMRFQPHTYGEIIIEDDVWIGSNAVIMPDVTVAKGTVIGAGAVVTKSTDPYCIVAGIPARKIGERN